MWFHECERTQWVRPRTQEQELVGAQTEEVQIAISFTVDVVIQSLKEMRTTRRDVLVTSTDVDSRPGRDQAF